VVKLILAAIAFGTMLVQQGYLVKATVKKDEDWAVVFWLGIISLTAVTLALTASV